MSDIFFSKNIVHLRDIYRRLARYAQSMLKLIANVFQAWYQHCEALGSNVVTELLLVLYWSNSEMFESSELSRQ